MTRTQIKAIGVAALTCALSPSVRAEDDKLGVGTAEDLLLSPDGRTVVVFGSTGTALLDSQTLASFGKVSQPTPANRVAFSVDSSLAVLAPCDATVIQLRKHENPVVLHCGDSQSKGCVKAFQISRDDPSILLICPDGQVSRRSTLDGHVLTQTRATGQPGAESPSGSAKLTPVQRNGAPFGLKVTNIKPESNWARAGVENGDIVLRVDGRPTLTSDMQSAVTSAVALGGLLDIDRKGQSISVRVASAIDVLRPPAAKAPAPAPKASPAADGGSP